MIDFFDSMVILIVARFARKSEIFFWNFHHSNEWDLAPTNDMHNKNTKISSFFEVDGGGRTMAERCAVVSKA